MNYLEAAKNALEDLKTAPFIEERTEWGNEQGQIAIIYALIAIASELREMNERERRTEEIKCWGCDEIRADDMNDCPHCGASHEPPF